MLRSIVVVLSNFIMSFLLTIHAQAASTNAGPTLIVEFALQDQKLYMRAQLGAEHGEFTVQGSGKEILRRFNNIYEILESLESNKLAAMRADTEFLSQKIIPPLEPFLAKAKDIVFQIDRDFVRAGLDLLEFKGKPLFLNFPVTYIVSSFDLHQESFAKIQDAYLMADLTCDPELGLQKVAKSLPKARYQKMEESSLATIKKAAKDVRALVLSAHGTVEEEDNSGHVAINKEELTAPFFANLKLDLVYFDSCQMGTAWDFIAGFRKHRSTRFFVAPIISNDAGDSSTKTVTWFFEGLQANKTPAQALAETRQKLYAFYHAQKLDEITVLNKSFAFRLYEFARK